MSIIIDKDCKVVVQGITGSEGRFHTAEMQKYGTRIVAGVTPNKGGQSVHDIPVYNTVDQAIRNHDVDTSIIFVPAANAQGAVVEAIHAGIKMLVVITELIPQKDVISFIAEAQKKGDVTIIGPNTPGIINPANWIHIGVMPTHVFQPGSIGMVSRSGTLTYEIAWCISQAGMGQSTCVGLGGDPVVGLDFATILEMFRHDDETECVVLIGEIGGSGEESAAHYIAENGYPKPVVAYVAGRLAPPEKRMGHAGAIITNEAGTAEGKIEAFIKAGVPVAEKPSDIVRLLKRIGA